MSGDEEPAVRITVGVMLHEMRDEMRAGFHGLNSRLDAQNGRLRKVEIVQATTHGRDVVVAAGAGVAGAGMMALVVWLIQRSAS